VGRSAGEGPEEQRRLEVELSASSMGTRQSSWHGRLGQRCGVDGAVLSWPGRTASALLWRLLAGTACWPVARCQCTARGGEARDAQE
jgi:hypothetical protein